VHSDPGLSPAEQAKETAQRIADLAARHREFADRLAERHSVMIPAEDPDFESAGPAFPAWPGPGRDAILQPPRPQMQPSARLAERIAGRDLDPDLEAGG
jgi:hypothetical protein